jgi:hypothetical protein
MQLGARIKPRPILTPAKLRAMQTFIAHGGRLGLFR